jgi:leucyl aminopeptidase (aminopeptidase T)
MTHSGQEPSSKIGGEIDVPIHLDALTLAPTIAVDGRVIIQDGSFFDLEL